MKNKTGGGCRRSVYKVHTSSATHIHYYIKHHTGAPWSSSGILIPIESSQITDRIPCKIEWIFEWKIFKSNILNALMFSFSCKKFFNCICTDVTNYF